ncbi:hypothetical protein E4K10_48160 [Streptomyces sp. T1317-0309]|nr:hypothetical protein E4K10_48160 [Streptomyces sp. T1317-0309]
MEDAQASLLLVDPTHRGHPVTGTGRCEAVDTDDIGDELAAFGGSDRNPVVAVHPDQLVHVMYTSGSSGTPKGVGITHRNVVDLLGNGRFWKGSHERVLLHSPSAFDASTTEFWGPLVTGGAIVVHPPGPSTSRPSSPRSRPCGPRSSRLPPAVPTPRVRGPEEPPGGARGVDRR